MNLVLKLVFFLVSAGVAFVFTLNQVPGLIMSRAMARMEGHGMLPHEFTLAPRMTPQTQTVVRPSPDLAYSICLFEFDGDTSELEIDVAGYGGMSSVSFFDARTNNFAVRRAPDGEPIRLTLHAPGQTDTGPAQHPVNTIKSPTRKGLILIRRLAPTAADYEQVLAASAGDACTPQSG